MTQKLYSISIPLAHTTLAGLTNVSELAGDNETLVFVHGYLDNANSFATLIPLLSNKQCLAIDLAGHGHSDHRSRDAHYHLMDYAYDLAQVIQSLNLKKVVLIGHSLGAIVCSIFASTQPVALSKLLILESCGPLSEGEHTSVEQITACFESRAKAQLPITQPKSLEHVIKARLAVSDLNEEQARLIMNRNLESIGNGVYRWRTDKKLRTKSPLRLTEKQAMNILCAIVCDFSIILGKTGFEKVKLAIEKRQEAFKRAEIVEFNGGHHVHLDSPNEVADYILQFLNN